MKTSPKHISTEFNIPDFALKAIEILNFNGFDAYVVGGCVRDMVRGYPPHDWDLCTNALPDEIKKSFEGYNVYETGIKHGTVTVVINRTSLEITTYRIDGKYSDGRHPDGVEFVSDLKADLQRRDFTINAMAYSPKTGLIDYFGGLDDIKNSLIRAVGNSDERFCEDALRILRALRFSSLCGFDIEDFTSSSIKRNYRLLSRVSAERIFSELKKLLLGDGCAKVLLEYTDVITYIIPELRPCVGYDQNNPHHCYDLWGHILNSLLHTPKDITLRLALLLHDIAKPECRSVDRLGISHYKNHPYSGSVMAGKILKRLRCDNKTISQVKTLILLHDQSIKPAKPEVKSYLNQLGLPLFRKLLVMKRADNLAKNPENNSGRLSEVDELENIVCEIVENNECYTLSKLAVSGSDIIKQGYRGKSVGKALNYLLRAVISGEAENTKSALLALIKKGTHDAQ